jgi:RNA polymerase sigma-70 factor, ECF subfamily
VHASDRALVERLLAGDGAAFDAFFDAHFPGLFRFALARLRHDADAAEDVAQSTLCRAVTKLHTYRGEASLFTWLCTFCRHELSAFHERAGRRPVTIHLIEDHPEIRGAIESLSMLAGGDDPAQQLEREELARRVHVTLDLLPARYAAALEWKYLDGFSVKQIAVRLGVSDKATESLLTRAREAFRDGFASLASQDAVWVES